MSEPLTAEELDALLNQNREWLGEVLGMEPPDNWQAILAAYERRCRAVEAERDRLRARVCHVGPNCPRCRALSNPTATTEATDDA